MLRLLMILTCPGNVSFAVQVLMFICILFSFLDINYLVNGPSDYVPTKNRWENTGLLGVESYKRSLLMLAGVASFTGAMSVVMAAKSRFSTYSWGFINIWTFGAVAWAYGYGGDAQMNIIFFTIMQVRHAVARAKAIWTAAATPFCLQRTLRATACYIFGCCRHLIRRCFSGIVFV